MPAKGRQMGLQKKVSETNPPEKPYVCGSWPRPLVVVSFNSSTDAQTGLPDGVFHAHQHAG